MVVLCKWEWAIGSTVNDAICSRLRSTAIWSFQLNYFSGVAGGGNNEVLINTKQQNRKLLLLDGKIEHFGEVDQWGSMTFE